jgi:predicted transcriptional regulator
MTVEQIAKIVNGSIVCGEKFRDKEIATACGSDMMSDVMAFYHDRGLLLTGLINIQVIRTASLLDLDGICFVRGKKPSREMTELAEENNLFIVETDLPMFPACGKLFAAGLKGN